MAAKSRLDVSSAARDQRARARYFQVLGDPTRLRLLELLVGREATVSELTEQLNVPRSRVSNHLACLKWCGFATAERRGREVVYRVADPRVRQVLRLSRSLSDEHCDQLGSCSRIGPDWI
jgi:DNA-binding transcriptional ArsR family regulator